MGTPRAGHPAHIPARRGRSRSGPAPPERKPAPGFAGAAVAGPLKGGAAPRRSLDTMLTSAITAAITAFLTWLGVPPGPYIAGVWVAVKVLIVAGIALLGWLAARRRRRPELDRASGRPRRADGPDARGRP